MSDHERQYEKIQYYYDPPVMVTEARNSVAVQEVLRWVLTFLKFAQYEISDRVSRRIRTRQV
jgi:hypothetical protein